MRFVMTGKIISKSKVISIDLSSQFDHFVYDFSNKVRMRKTCNKLMTIQFFGWLFGRYASSIYESHFTSIIFRFLPHINFMGYYGLSFKRLNFYLVWLLLIAFHTHKFLIIFFIELHGTDLCTNNISYLILTKWSHEVHKELWKNKSRW